MAESDTDQRRNPFSAPQWAILLFSVAVIGFSLAFIRRITHAPTGPSVLSPPTWIDRYWNFMTHPAMILVELSYVGILFAKERRPWWRLLLAGLIGAFLGQLVHKLIAT